MLMKTCAYAKIELNWKSVSAQCWHIMQLSA